MVPNAGKVGGAISPNDEPRRPGSSADGANCAVRLGAATRVPSGEWYNASWATTQIVVVHIPDTTS